jgi:hypothetical protein
MSDSQEQRALPDLQNLIPEHMLLLSDDQLWELVYRPFPAQIEARSRAITELGRLLTDEEQAELDQIIHEYDRFVLLRSQALLLLKTRGHDVETRLGIRKWHPPKEAL